jgi:hypothetical protein
MYTLPDPRCFAATTADPLSRLATRAAHAADATQRRRLLDELQRELREALASGSDGLLTQALASASSPAAGRTLWEALDRATNTPADPQSVLAARVFAIPVVFVAGGLAGATIPGRLSDTKAVARVLETQGALGPTHNFGLSPALCAEPSLECVSPSRRYALLRGVESGHVEPWPDLIPADIRLESAEESVHLRFLAGIVVAPARARSFLETAGDIGRWGMPLSRELLRQFGQEGLSLLPLPRLPAGLMTALHEGRWAREEVAFQTFASRVLRRLRSETADPEVEIAALESGSLGVRLVSPFDRTRAEVHRWKLDALDDLAQVTASILGLFAECGVSAVRLLERVLPDAEFLGD